MKTTILFVCWIAIGGALQAQQKDEDDWHLPAVRDDGYVQGRQTDESETPQFPSEGSEIEARFIAKVEWIELMPDREAEVIPLWSSGIELVWQVGIEILSVQKAEKPFDKRTKKILLVHSPSMIFHVGYEEAVGKMYAFRVIGSKHAGIPMFQSAEVQEIQNLDRKSEVKCQARLTCGKRAKGMLFRRTCRTEIRRGHLCADAPRPPRTMGAA